MDTHLDRSVIASWASMVGGIALVAGALLFLITRDISTWVFLCVLLGAGGIGLWLWWTPDELQAWLSGRQTRFGTTSVLAAILFVGLLVSVYVLVDRANITLDFTARQRYSLNRPTLDTIEQLQERGFRVRIVGFFSGDKLRDQESADLLLRQYEAAGDGDIEIEYIDPDEKPDIALQYGYQPGYDGDLFLAVLGADGEPDFRSPPLYLGGVNERDITTGLKTIASAGEFKIYFTTGHGELDLERVDRVGISRLRVSLEGAGIGVDTLQLLDVLNTGIPDDASAILIMGPRVPFTEEEVQVLADYVSRGGRLGIFADPPYVDQGTAFTNTFLLEDSPFSQYLWNEFGVRVRADVVIETETYIGNEFTPLVDQIAPHTMLADVRDAQIIMQFVRSIDLVAEPDATQNQYVREPLLYSSGGSYGETGLDAIVTESRIQYNDGIDIPGPLLMGVTVRRNLELQETVQPRLVIFGDSDVFKNDFVEEYPGNVFLWTDTIDWLTGFAQAVTFSPVSDPTLLNVVVSDRERTTIAYITMLALPGAVLAAGIIVWWYRRR
jgi:hypothetical protein